VKDQYGNMTGKGFVIISATVTVFIFTVIGLLMATLPAYNRYQARAKAKNQVKINHTKIQYFDQQKQIERRQAEIRVIHSVGIRKAQDEIQATLTPLYVQFEMVHALEQIAQSGRNNSVVFVPTTGNGGIPLIPGLTEKVGK
jgi:predicted histidine transporter YuiF (NhaC family)